MNRIRYTVIGLQLVFLHVSSLACAQSSATSAQPSEVAILRAQLETIRFFHDSFMSMALWALGTAIAIVLALAVFSWFTNKANYDRDRELIRDQGTALREELIGILVQKVAEERQELEKGLTARQATLQQAIERTLQEKLDKLQGEIKEAAEIALELKADVELRDADQAEKDGRYQWAIYKYCETIDIYVKLGADFCQAAEVLDRISTILKRPGVSLDADTVSSTVQTLQRLPRQHHAVTESLIIRLKKALA